MEATIQLIKGILLLPDKALLSLWPPAAVALVV
jgi:hypothetical protein